MDATCISIVLYRRTKWQASHCIAKVQDSCIDLKHFLEADFYMLDKSRSPCTGYRIKAHFLPSSSSVQAVNAGSGMDCNWVVQTFDGFYKTLVIWEMQRTMPLV